MDKVEAVWIIDDRIDGIANDLKAFVYIRIHSIQHGSDDIGGGNVTSAIALFSALNFLAKIQYYLDKRGRTPIDDTGMPLINEEVAFIHLVKKLADENISLGLPTDNMDALKLVWSGFRNKLAHVSTVQDGKQVMAYTITDAPGGLTPTLLLSEIKNEEPFQHDGQYRNWKLNVDVLLAKLPMIKRLITHQLCNGDQTTIDYALLEKIIG